MDACNKSMIRLCDLQSDLSHHCFFRCCTVPFSYLVAEKQSSGLTLIRLFVFWELQKYLNLGIKMWPFSGFLIITYVVRSY